jgi:dTDP-4-amino-4,6-dideoxygalactose transaminase
MVIFVQGNHKDGISRRDFLFDQLHQADIQTKKYFYPCLHKLTAYHNWKDHSFPVAEKASLEGLALPLYGHMEEETVDFVSNSIINILKK